jgi:uncharacterized protein (DUF433 family)
MDKFDRITMDSSRMNGEAYIRNLRLTVRRVLEALATYPDREELKREYPELEDEDIRQALALPRICLTTGYCLYQRTDEAAPRPRASSFGCFLSPQAGIPMSARRRRRSCGCQRRDQSGVYPTRQE